MKPPVTQTNPTSRIIDDWGMEENKSSYRPENGQRSSNRSDITTEEDFTPLSPNSTVSFVDEIMKESRNSGKRGSLAFEVAALAKQRNSAAGAEREAQIFEYHDDMASVNSGSVNSKKANTLLPLTRKRSSAALIAKAAVSRCSIYSEKAKIKAVIKIQALARGYMLRHAWLREDAAVMIQSVYRGYRARVYVVEMIEELLAQGKIVL
jgi:hypothetical protein